MGSLTFFFSHRERVVEIFSGLFSPIELDEDERLSEEELKEMEENKEQTMMEIKANNWFKMIYYLTKGDITKTEKLMTTNANYIFHTLGFEKNNQQWVNQFR